MKDFLNRIKPDGGYLSKENCDSVKGIFAVFVVIHHCRNNMTSLSDSVLGMILTAVGYLSVAMFFFISAYGMETKVINDKEAYIKTFPRNRILYLYAVSVCSVVFYATYKITFFDGVPLKSFLVSMTFGQTIMAYGWYLQAIVIICILFYLLIRFCAGVNEYVGLFIGTIAYIILSLLFSSEPLLYIQSILAFPLGIVLAHKKTEFDNWCEVHRIGAIIITFIGFSITLLVGNLPIGSKLIWIPCKMISAVFFVLFVLTVMQRMNMSSIPFANKLGLIFSEIYIMQEVPISFLRSKYVYIENDFLHLIVTLIVVIILAVLVRPFFGWVYWSIRKTT